ncbi:GNAT family N-acetyltransferase [Pseudomonas sp. NA-150]|uniref:GNAT family N-acetyltransferase n=1 Tax=Pseudomonas sp. NA-150 TaxID=3367525 RepID=UPI0037C79E91
MSFTIHWLSRSQDIEENIWRRCFKEGQKGLFWFRTLEQSKLDDQFRFLYGLLLRDGEPVGIVPAFVFDLPMKLVAPPALMRVLDLVAVGWLRRLRYQRTFFIGSVADEEGAIGLDASVRLADVALLIHEAARAKANQLGAPLLTWKDFEQSACAALDPLAASRRAFRMVSFPGTVVPILPGGFEALLAKQKSSRRHQMRKKLRRGDEGGPVVVSVVSQPSDEELQELFALFQQTYEKATTHFERLSIDYFRAIAACEEAVFVVLRGEPSGRAEAFMLMLKQGPRLINQFIGIDYMLGESSFLYFRLFAAAYDWAATTDAKLLHSGQTGYRPKLDLGHQLLPLWNYVHHRNPLINYLFARVCADVSWRTLDPDLAVYLDAHPDVIERAALEPGDGNVYSSGMSAIPTK